MSVPDPMTLTSRDVHVWTVPLAPDARVDEYATMLSAPEYERAAGLRTRPARTRFVVTRGRLREILAGYLDAAPGQVALRQNAWGKPCLGGGHAASGITFNVTHSGSLALVAIARGRDVGIDVEACLSRPHLPEMAARFFSAREAAALDRLAPPSRLRAFVATWARKEAFIKARGEGLSLPLDRFSVEVDPDRPARLLDADRPGEVERWSMTSLPTDAGYVAALVVEGHGWRVQAVT